MALTTPTMTTARLRLRPFGPADADDLVALHTDRVVLRYWDSPPWEGPERVDGFLARCISLAAQGTGVRVAVEDPREPGLLGWVQLGHWNPAFRSARLGYCYARTTWGRGVATEAARALLGWAFETLDLNRVQADVDTRNPASARVLHKLGFVREGTLRQDCVVEGVVSDSWVYGLLREE